MKHMQWQAGVDLRAEACTCMLGGMHLSVQDRLGP